MRLCVTFDCDLPTHGWSRTREFFMLVDPGLTYAEYLRQAETEAQAWTYPASPALKRVVLLNDRYTHIATLFPPKESLHANPN